MSPIEALGQAVIDRADALSRWGRLAAAAVGQLLTGRWHRRNTLAQLAFIGVDSMPIALLIAASVGMVFTLQIASEFIRYGATSAIGGVVGVAVARELSPILISVVVAGRVGSAIAAELGSMKVTEQIDALEAFAVDPVRYLVVPRLLACVAMLPLMVVLGDAVGLVGGYFVATLAKGISSSLYLESIRDFMTVSDVLKGMLKGALFGGMIALIGCHQGMNAKKGAQGVGAATTNAVVYAMIAIFVLNYFLSMLLFPGGRA